MKKSKIYKGSLMKSIPLFLLLSTILLPLSGEEVDLNTPAVTEDHPTTQAPSLERWFLEFKPGYYYLTGACARAIYDHGGFAFRFEADYRIYSDYLLIWFDGGYFTKNGHSLGGESISTKMQLGSITLGLKGIYFWDYCAIYGGAGPRLFILSVENDTPYVKDQNKTGVGGGFTAGLLIFPWARSLGFLDLFVDYSLKSVDFSSSGTMIGRDNVDIGGITAGAGLGVRF